jgi:hypothetical protein
MIAGSPDSESHVPISRVGVQRRGFFGYALTMAAGLLAYASAAGIRGATASETLAVVAFFGLFAALAMIGEYVFGARLSFDQRDFCIRRYGLPSKELRIPYSAIDRVEVRSTLGPCVLLLKSGQEFQLGPWSAWTPERSRAVVQSTKLEIEARLHKS